MKSSLIPALALCIGLLTLTACDTHKEHGEQAGHEQHKIIATTAQAQDITITQQYVCQIHSQKHIQVKAMESGYLERVTIKEGQTVKTDDVLFRVRPMLFKAKLDAELAEVRLAELELANTKRLEKDKVVSVNEVALFEAKLAKAEAKAKLAQAELALTEVRAPFDGIVDRLHEQHGSLVKEGEILTTLSDNSTMWVYFNVPEVKHQDYQKQQKSGSDPSRLKLGDSRIELVLANGQKFSQNAGDTVTVEATFHHETGNIAYRADFPNPERLLRHGQTGNIQLNRVLKGALVIPQRATYEILDKRYVFVIGANHVVKQRPITVLHEMDDVFIVSHDCLSVRERFILEGVRQVRDGQHVEYEMQSAETALAHQKKAAE